MHNDITGQPKPNNRFVYIAFPFLTASILQEACWVIFINISTVLWQWLLDWLLTDCPNVFKLSGLRVLLRIRLFVLKCVFCERKKTYEQREHISMFWYICNYRGTWRLSKFHLFVLKDTYILSIHFERRRITKELNFFI